MLPSVLQFLVGLWVVTSRFDATDAAEQQQRQDSNTAASKTTTAEIMDHLVVPHLRISALQEQEQEQEQAQEELPRVEKEHSRRRRRSLPEKVLIGYATTCDVEKVTKAVEQGLNVVIWAFLGSKKLDLECIDHLIDDLDSQGYDDTVHLISWGGWNGPHWNNSCKNKNSATWYESWKEEYGQIFHGIDVDWEGNSVDDRRDSPLNYLSIQELENMGEVLQLAKDDGYITSIVPPQSYLDISSTKFSRYLNLTDSTRTWHKDFGYFGQNAYAYWLAKYPDAIDLIIVQFYESYSRAAMEIQYHKLPPETYLSMYVQDLVSNQHETFQVDFFTHDPDLGLPNQNVSLPLSKLVWGFQNHHCTSAQEKCFFVPSECIQAAYQNLWDWMMMPRGFMFWLIDHEGEEHNVNGEPFYYAKELNEVLHIRS